MIKGIETDEINELLQLQDPGRLHELFKRAGRIKQEIYGERIVFFAPLYLSNFCVNDCKYCAFHAGNNHLTRKKLTLDEIEEQANILINMGHKRILLECGEDPDKNATDYVVSAMERIYSIKRKQGNIRRINVNIAATTVENYKKLKAAGIGTYQLFQETYHRPTYAKLHKGPKADYDRQISALEKAYKAGIDDFGGGILFGLYDYKFEVLSLISHIKMLEKNIGIGPHTISVPRFRPADSVDYKAEYAVSDQDFLKIIAILRLAVPYTGLILSTRESAKIRAKAFEIGISQTSAASINSPGGYSKNKFAAEGQFHISDCRSLDSVIESILSQDLLPSFCTACYRRGRTGGSFMDLAKPGEIHKFCRSNGILTFMEYLEDHASSQVKKEGIDILNKYLNKVEDANLKKATISALKRIKAGERDLFF